MNASIGLWIGPRGFAIIGAGGLRIRFSAQISSARYLRLVQSAPRPPLVLTVTPSLTLSQLLFCGVSVGQGAPASIHCLSQPSCSALSLSASLGGMARSGSSRVAA